MSRFYSTIRGLRKSNPEIFWEAFAPTWIEIVTELYPTPHAPGSRVNQSLKFAGIEVTP